MNGWESRDDITRPSPYYLDRGGFNGVHRGMGSAQLGLLQGPPNFKNLSNPNISVHPNVGGITGISVGGPSTFNVENSPHSSSHRMSLSVVPQSGDTVKKKRGRPRKYGPGGPPLKVSLKLLSPDQFTTGEKPRRGRPPGSGWKQKLAPFGEWMNSSAGLAFTPHVLHIGVGEDVAAKILAFAQQRPRALCILSGSGSISAVTLRQPTTSAGSLTYEGRFEILCLSGSYLISESGSQNRIGGISISFCSPDGHLIGGAVGGSLIAANHVQVVACSFVYDSNKGKAIPEPGANETYLLEHSAEKSQHLMLPLPNQTTDSRYEK